MTSIRREYLAIALVSAAVVLFEVAIVRLLSVVLWYHFAFLSLSLAMLGLGVPGVWYAIRPPGKRALPAVLVGSAIALPLSILAMIRIGPHLRAVGTAANLGNILRGDASVLTVFILAPFILLGAAVCILLLRAEGKRISTMYGADLVGATLGAIAVVPLLMLVPTPALLAGLGFLPLAALLLVAPDSWKPAAAVAAGLAGLLAWGQPLELNYNKRTHESTLGEKLYEKWTPTGRLTVFEEFPQGIDKTVPYGWGFGSKFEPGRIDQLWLEQDGGAGTPITSLGPDVDVTDDAVLPHLYWDVTSVGYQLHPPQRVAVIGSGGGRDVLTALKAGATHIDAVEQNPWTIRGVRTEFGEFSGDVYGRAGVVPHAAEGRSFLTRSEGNYDLIQISLIDSFAATAAGAYALSENYLYTTEAFELYLDRLAPGGVLSVSRYVRGHQALEGGRAAVLAQAALKARGAAEPEQHIAVVQGDVIATVLVSRDPFTPADLARLDAIGAERGFERLWPNPAKISAVARALVDGPDYLLRHGIDLSAPTDDAPFFFQTVGLWRELSEEAARTVGFNEWSSVLLKWLFLFLLALSAVMFLVPLALAGKIERAPGFWSGSAFFVAIGAAFMLVEVPWIQRFILYLGHPSFATPVVLGTLLAGAGGGALLSGRLTRAQAEKAVLLLPLVVGVVALLIAPLFAATLGLPTPVRVLLSIVVLLPAGFLMGVPFPLGMVAFDERNKAWFWAMNGTAGVLSSVSSLALAMTVGFFGTTLLGVVCYLLAVLALRRAPAAS